MSEILDVGKLKEKISDFAKERDWEQFHGPKNLAMALSVEVAELVEILQWLTTEEAKALIADSKELEKVADELADIAVYTVSLASIYNINLPEAIERKMEKNAKKYPVDKVRGKSKKYNEY